MDTTPGHPCSPPGPGLGVSASSAMRQAGALWLVWVASGSLGKQRSGTALDVIFAILFCLHLWQAGAALGVLGGGVPVALAPGGCSGRCPSSSGRCPSASPGGTTGGKGERGVSVVVAPGKLCRCPSSSPRCPSSSPLEGSSPRCRSGPPLSTLPAPGRCSVGIRRRCRGMLVPVSVVLAPGGSSPRYPSSVVHAGDAPGGVPRPHSGVRHPRPRADARPGVPPPSSSRGEHRGVSVVSILICADGWGGLRGAESPLGSPRPSLPLLRYGRQDRLHPGPVWG